MDFPPDELAARRDSRRDDQPAPFKLGDIPPAEYFLYWSRPQALIMPPPIQWRVIGGPTLIDQFGRPIVSREEP